LHWRRYLGVVAFTIYPGIKNYLRRSWPFRMIHHSKEFLIQSARILSNKIRNRSGCLPTWRKPTFFSSDTQSFYCRENIKEKNPI
jgi:hypothetical protein